MNKPRDFVCSSSVRCTFPYECIIFFSSTTQYKPYTFNFQNETFVIYVKYIEKKESCHICTICEKRTASMIQATDIFTSPCFILYVPNTIFFFHISYNKISSMHLKSHEYSYEPSTLNSIIIIIFSCLCGNSDEMRSQTRIIFDTKYALGSKGIHIDI